MQIKRAILTVLATRPDGRARLDELKDEVEALTANEDQPGDPSCSLDDIDIFQSGLVIPEDGGLQITKAGRSALKALEGPGKYPLDLPPTRGSHSLAEERRKIFDLELRSDEVDFSPEGAEIEDSSSMSTMSPARETDADLPRESIAQSTPHEAGFAYLQGSEPITVVAPDSMPADALGFLVRDASGSEVSAPERERPWRSRLSRLISAKHQQARYLAASSGAGCAECQKGPLTDRECEWCGYRASQPAHDRDLCRSCNCINSDQVPEIRSRNPPARALTSEGTRSQGGSFGKRSRTLTNKKESSKQIRR